MINKKIYQIIINKYKMRNYKLLLQAYNMIRSNHSLIKIIYKLQMNKIYKITI
jgi:hypothetical protein